MVLFIDRFQLLVNDLSGVAINCQQKSTDEFHPGRRSWPLRLPFVPVGYWPALGDDIDEEVPGRVSVLSASERTTASR